MILLLDTHALIWALEDSPRLSPTARAAIVDGKNTVLASAASGWEIGIKRGLGRLDTPDDLEAAIDAAGFGKRMITFADALRVAALPPHHRDPFDRMLVAQALEDGIPLVSCDPLVARYPIQIVW
ncbi:MAG: type II toxin-antitoxin system VapC family toxin [Myxococcales bacterium]|nr:type II toxin-antitoxin system VapC family toxin [Myxococcales bacterium]